MSRQPVRRGDAGGVRQSAINRHGREPTACVIIAVLGRTVNTVVDSVPPAAVAVYDGICWYMSQYSFQSIDHKSHVWFTSHVTSSRCVFVDLVHTDVQREMAII